MGANHGELYLKYNITTNCKVLYNGCNAYKSEITCSAKVYDNVFKEQPKWPKTIMKQHVIFYGLRCGIIVFFLVSTNTSICCKISIYGTIGVDFNMGNYVSHV